MLVLWYNYSCMIKGFGNMKILFVNKYLYPKGGADIYVLKLGQYLESIGHEVQYFGMFDDRNEVGNGADAYTAHVDFHKASPAYLTYPFRIIYSRDARKRIRRVLDSFKPDVVHTNNINFQITPSILYEIKRDNIPIIHTAHDIQWVCPNHMMTNPETGKSCRKCLDGRYIDCVKNKCVHGSYIRSAIGAAESRLYRSLHTYRLADRIICPSRFMEESLSANPDLLGKTEVVYNFIDRLPKRTYEKKGYALYFGRYSKEKGVGTIIKAARELPDIRFVFAGRGDYADEIAETPNITDVGFKSGDDLYTLIGEADFSILASETGENCPFSVMESQTLGTTVIGARIGGIPELIAENKTGLLFKSGDKDQLKEKIRYLHENAQVRKALEENCAELKYDTVDKYAAKIVDIYGQFTETENKDEDSVYRTQENTLAGGRR